MSALPARRRSLIGLFTLILIVLARLPAVAQGQSAVLDLTVNGVSQGQILVVLSAHEVWAEVTGLERAGLVSFGGERETRHDRAFVRLASLSPQVRFEVDEMALALRLIVAPALLGRTVRDIAFDRPKDIEYHRVPSGFLNYGASASTTGTRALSLEGGVSAAGALLTTSAFANSTGGFLRGLTALTIDDRRRLNRYVLGDTVATTGALGGSLQLAGASVSRDYSLDPYFVRYPTIGLSGAVMTKRIFPCPRT